MYQFLENEKRRAFWRVRFSVTPNEVGYLYRKNRLEKKLEPGIYDYFDFKRVLNIITLPTTDRIQNVINQEVLTRDNIALRLSFFVQYKICDSDKYVENFNVFENSYQPFLEAEQLIHNLSQVHLRRIISGIESEELSEKRNEILPDIPADLQKELGEYGVELTRLLVRDLTFPKSIQDLLSKSLESKIRAKADLENARTQVAAARALKNASEMMKGDDNIKFIQYLETITKIAENGKHTFLVGDLSQNAVNLKKDQ
ncbi:MAG: slipin family protein [Pyrinomonadaceae bacterium]|nr:slipin family protein [Pyrinomonadaceae bacterium]